MGNVVFVAPAAVARRQKGVAQKILALSVVSGEIHRERSVTNKLTFNKHTEALLNVIARQRGKL